MSLKRFKNHYSLSEIEDFVRSPLTKRYTEYFLVRHDDTILQDITEWIKPGGTISKNSNSGQSRSTSLTFNNEKTTFTTGYKNGIPIKEEKFIWTPTPGRGGIWEYNKIKIVTNLILDDDIYEIDEGIFVLHDPNLSFNNSENTVNIQCYDKFALIDGTIEGTTDIDYEIPVGTPVYQAIESILHLRRGNGLPFDLKPVSFPTKYKNVLTPYTLRKTSDSSLGEIIIELTKMISCDARYDDEGILVITDTLADLDYHLRPVSWDYRANEFKNPTLNIERSKIKNKVTVVGSNINGRVCKGVAINNNPASNYNINSPFGLHSTKITDDLIYSDILCTERARYELKKFAQNYASLNFTSNYIPHIEPGDIIRWTYEPWEIEQEEFLINTINVPLDGKNMMSLSCTNVKELPI